MKRAILLGLSAAMVLTTNVYADDYLWPDDVYQMCENASKEVTGGKLSPELLQAVIERESCYIADIDNGNCKGLMQINPKYHADRIEKYDADDLHDAYKNICVGASYLWDLYEMSEDDYEDDSYWVLMMYSMNHDTAQKNWEAGKYSKYAIKIMDRVVELEKEHGK